MEGGFCENEAPAILVTDSRRVAVVLAYPDKVRGRASEGSSHLSQLSPKRVVMGLLAVFWSLKKCCSYLSSQLFVQIIATNPYRIEHCITHLLVLALQGEYINIVPEFPPLQPTLSHR